MQQDSLKTILPTLIHALFLWFYFFLFAALESHLRGNRTSMNNNLPSKRLNKLRLHFPSQSTARKVFLKILGETQTYATPH